MSCAIILVMLTNILCTISLAVSDLFVLTVCNIEQFQLQ